MTAETKYLAISLVARIHPGDREAIDETIQRILCPIGHFDEAGDQPMNETDCRMDWYASTVVDDIEKALDWASPITPNDASKLETT